MSSRRKKTDNDGTSLLDNKNARAVINFLKHSGIPFTLTCSNYTTKVESEIMNKKFVHSMQSNRVFAAYSKIKSDVKRFAPPDIDKAKLNYFYHDFNRSFDLPVVYNLDLKSAYATVLLRQGYIEPSTYAYLHTIPKRDRLASVGMLASRKMVFQFDGMGEVIDAVEQVSENENYFYLAVRETYKIMSTLRAMLGPGYLFTWVDGVYFLSDHRSILQCADYLDSVGFNFTFEELSNFRIRYDDKGIRIDFNKEGKPKQFNLPPKQGEFTRIMTDAIISYNSKIKNNEFQNDHDQVQEKPES